MFIKYSNLVKKMIGEMFKSKGRADIFTLFETIKYSFLLILSIVLFCTVIIITFGLPVFGYKKFISPYKKDWENKMLLPDVPEDEIKGIIKKIKRNTIIYCLVLITLYIPIALPTMLYLINIITGGML